MQRLTKTGILLASLLLLATPLPNVGAISDNESVISTTFNDGVWVNDTLTINGSTTVPAQYANWALYDVTDPYAEWEELQSGDYFTEVIPIDEGLWAWSITIDVSGHNCTCWLEISQPDGLEKALLNRIIFIGEGPHNPVVSPIHPLTIFVDDPVELSTIGILSIGNASESIISLEWCYAPLGACDGDYNSSEVSVVWNHNQGTFTIDADALGLTDGVWQFSYTLQDEYLRDSPPVNFRVNVDQTDPDAILICPEQALEGDLVIIDGTESRDGVWGPSSLQAVWYITQPDGVYRVAEPSETNGMLFNLIPNQSGNYSIQLDVVDSVGRRSSSTVQILVINVEPVFDLQIDETNIPESESWQLIEGEDFEISVLATDTGMDNETLVYQWYLDGEIVSSTTFFASDDLDVGAHDLLLVVTDDDGASKSHEIQITVTAKESSDENQLDLTVLLLFVVIVGVGITVFRRVNMSEHESSGMPKWGDSPSSKVEKPVDGGSDDNQMWDESDASYGGKD